MPTDTELEVRPLEDNELEAVSAGFSRGFFYGENITYTVQDTLHAWNTALQLTDRK
ncbi:hypothetical protein [Bradyrhizobium sp. AZCC 2289]|uniref:hypothetical protein n=1 Tax=Bradyrhizobium sp. AZCC 2289 TaxID=3117026 RepID=UPI002FEE9B8A